MNTQPDVVCIDVMSTLFGISIQNDLTHSVQVWVLGYELHWKNQMMPTYLWMNTPPDMIRHDEMWIDVAAPLEIIWPTVSIYEFQVISRVGIIKWHLYTWIHKSIWFVLMWYRGDSRFTPIQWGTALLCNDVCWVQTMLAGCKPRISPVISTLFGISYHSVQVWI